MSEKTLQFLLGYDPKQHHNSITSIKYYDKWFCTASRDATIRIWNKSDNQLIRVMHGHTSWVNDLLVLEDGKILSGAKDHRVKLWMSDSGRCTSIVTRKTYIGHTDSVQAIRENIAADVFYSAGLSNQLYQWNVDRVNEPIINFVAAKDLKCSSFYAMELSKDAVTLCTGSSDGYVRFWDPRLPNPLLSEVLAHEDVVRCLCENNQNWVSGGADGSICFWDLRTMKLVTEYTYTPFPTIGTSVFNLFPWKNEIIATYQFPNEISSDNSILMNTDLKLLRAPQIDSCIGNITKAIVCSVSSVSNETSILLSSHQPIIHVTKSEDENSVLICTQDACVWRLSLTSENLEIETPLSPNKLALTRFLSGQCPIFKYSILSDGRSLLTVSLDKNVKLWDILSAKLVSDFGNGEKECLESGDKPFAFFEHMRNKLSSSIQYVPTWCSVDLRLGSPLIQLDQKNADNADDIASKIYENVDEDEKLYRVSYSNVAIKTVFWEYIKYRRLKLKYEEKLSQIKSNELPVTPSAVELKVDVDAKHLLERKLSLEKLVPLDMISKSNIPIFLYLALNGDNSIGIYNLVQRTFSFYDKVMPEWILTSMNDFTTVNAQSKENHVKFQLLPFPGCNLPKVSRDLEKILSAPGALSVKKICAHLSASFTTDGEYSSEVKAHVSLIKQLEEFSSTDEDLANYIFEISCRDVVLPLAMDIISVRQLIWRSAVKPAVLRYVNEDIKNLSVTTSDYNSNIIVFHYRLCPIPPNISYLNMQSNMESCGKMMYQ